MATSTSSPPTRASLYLVLCLGLLLYWTGIEVVANRAKIKGRNSLLAHRTRHLLKSRKHPPAKEVPGLAENVKAVCDKHKVSARQRTVNLIVDRRHRLYICLNPKAATRTLLRHMLVVAGMVANHTEVSRLFLRRARKKLLVRRLKREFVPVSHVLKDITTAGYSLVSFVRHPFDRFVSAYENKIKYVRDSTPYFKMLAKQVHHDFAEFADFVIRRSANSFFNLNRHWCPMYMQCGYCSLPYEYVGKVEQMPGDFVRMLELVGASEHLDRLNVSLRKNNSPAWPNKTAHYMGLLSPDVRRQIYKLYEPDFEMFDYSAKDYL